MSSLLRVRPIIAEPEAFGADYEAKFAADVDVVAEIVPAFRHEETTASSKLQWNLADVTLSLVIPPAAALRACCTASVKVPL